MKNWASLILFVVLAACTTTYPTPLPPPPEQPPIEVEDPVCVSCGWILDEPELRQYLSRAEADDADAALRVYMHYVSLEDREQRDYWLRRAADLGNPSAQYNLWSYLRDAPSCTDRLTALSWLEKAAAQGLAPAKSELDGFRKQVTACRPAPEMRPNNSFKPKPLRGSA